MFLRDSITCRAGQTNTYRTPPSPSPGTSASQVARAASRQLRPTPPPQRWPPRSRVGGGARLPHREPELGAGDRSAPRVRNPPRIPARRGRREPGRPQEARACFPGRARPPRGRRCARGSRPGTGPRGSGARPGDAAPSCPGPPDSERAERGRRGANLPGDPRRALTWRELLPGAAGAHATTARSLAPQPRGSARLADRLAAPAARSRRRDARSRTHAARARDT